MTTSDAEIAIVRDGHVLRIGFARPAKRNAVNFAMLQALCAAYGELDRDPDLRVGFVYAVGDHFTAGLDLADIAPRIGDTGLSMVPDGGVNPWQVDGRTLSKPVVVAIQGTCLTLGIELALASDIVVAAESSSFAQSEVLRGILPFGGATTRFPRVAGWSNAMRWMLTGDRFDAEEARRLGIVQEVVPDGQVFARGLELAHRVAASAPLAVQATIRNARLAVREGERAAEAQLQPELVRLMHTTDAALGLEAFRGRTVAAFEGR